MEEDIEELDALIEGVDPSTGPDYHDFISLVKMVRHMRRLSESNRGRIEVLDERIEDTRARCMS